MIVFPNSKGWGFIFCTALLVCSPRLYAQNSSSAAGPRFSYSNTGNGIERASGERLATAIGYYARSRSLLIQAISEFDKARKLANPEVLIDADEWRNSLVSRAQDLERVLAPQARATRGGVTFQSSSQLLKQGN